VKPAFVDEDNNVLERRVRDLEAKPRLDLDVVAGAITRIRRPDVVAERLGDAIRYSQRVEAEVAGLSIETLLPHANDDYDGRFLTVWVPDELGHGDAQEMLLRHLDLPVFDPRGADVVPLHNRIAGFLGRLSRHAYEMVSMTYHTIGAINERLAMGAYGQMATIAAEVGESELAQKLFTHLRRDESGHLGYYRAYARQLRPRLKAWQLAVVRALIVHTYAPVGAGCAPDKAPFGRVLMLLEDDPEDPSVAGAVQDIAQELLAKPGTELPPFVLGAMHDCVDRARAEAAA
jgi:hypothetical protein